MTTKTIESKSDAMDFARNASVNSADFEVWEVKHPQRVVAYWYVAETDTHEPGPFGRKVATFRNGQELKPANRPRDFERYADPMAIENDE